VTLKAEMGRMQKAAIVTYFNDLFRKNIIQDNRYADPECNQGVQNDVTLAMSLGFE
jgi:hypothetical protein